jgi:orotate phosphoribosyltransferase
MFPRSVSELDSLFDFLNREISEMRVVGFASRMGIIEAIQSFGCKVLPENWSTLAWPYSHDPEITGTIPLRPITTGTDLTAATTQLSNDLERIFGEYASVDVIRGGALSNVIVHELGANILHHAKSGCGFLMTRIVHGASRKHFVGKVVGEKTPSFFRPGGVAESGFVELVVCDDGIGIPDSLREDLKRTLMRRPELRTRLKPDRDEDVIAYAFDRLSSSKRSAVDLLAEAYQELPLLSASLGGVASGLFWVWNVMRTYQGFIRVRSGNCELAYDFADVDANGQPKPSVATAPLVGTQLGICLPLTKQSKDLVSLRGRNVAKAELPSRTFDFFWVGDLSGRLPVEELQTRVLPERMKDLCDQIRSAFERSAKDDSVLVLDLTSLHREWFHKNASIVVGAILELNYLSPIGLHAAVLFNAPVDRQDVLLAEFRTHCELLRRHQPHLANLRLATAVFWDDRKSADFVSPSETVCDVLSCLGNSSGDFSVDDIYKDALARVRARGATLEEQEVARILRENGHIVRQIPAYGTERRFRLVLSSDIMLQKARDCYAAELGKIAETETLDSTTLQEGRFAFVRRIESGQGAFWLPSSGSFANEFWQLGMLASSMMWRSRIGWLLADRIAQLADQGKIVTCVATVTRSTALFAEESSRFLRGWKLDAKVAIADDMSSLRRRLSEVVASGCEKSEKKGSILFFTDVVSTGRLVKDGLRELSEAGYNVVGVFALADIRTASEKVRDNADSLTSCLAALIRKPVPKSDQCVGHRTDIDEFEVCPVGTVPETLWKRRRAGKGSGAMWILEPTELIPLAAAGEGLATGHLRMGDYHHYVFYMKASSVLDRIFPGTRETVQSKLVEIIKDDLGKSAPEDMVVMYLNHEGQDWQDWVNLVCEGTGSLWRHILYRDLRGGRWQFSAFVEHGVPLAGKHVILLDDGTCTGDTLAALIETAAVGGAKGIFAYVLVDRMPLVKSDLFARVRTLEAARSRSPRLGATVQIRALGGLQIPVYTPEACPICTLRNEIEEVRERFICLDGPARSMREGLEATEAAGALKSGGAKEVPDRFPWVMPASSSLLWNVRQALEYFPYEEPTGDGGTLDSISFLEQSAQERDGALALAFIACTEPHLTTHKWFRKNSELLLNRWIARAGEEGLEDGELATLLAAIYRLSASPGLLLAPARKELSMRVAGVLRNDVISQSASERLLVLVAAGLLSDQETPSYLNAAHWLRGLYQYAQEHWLEYPLLLTACRLRQTRFLERLAVPSQREMINLVQELHQHLEHLVIFVGLHSTAEEVELRVAELTKGIRERATVENVSEVRTFLEEFQGKLDSLFRCSELLSRLTHDETEWGHPLIINSTISRELRLVCQLYAGVLNATEWSYRWDTSPSVNGQASRSDTSAGILLKHLESIQSLWVDCKPAVQNFLRFILVDVQDESNKLLNGWLRGKADVEASLTAGTVRQDDRYGIVPVTLLRECLAICLDNAHAAYGPHARRRKVTVCVEVQASHIFVSILDEGKPFEPASDISKRQLGRIKCLLHQLQVEVQLPGEGEAPKKVVIRVPKASLGPRWSQKESDYEQL